MIVVSIIIPTKNSATYLEKCLRSIESQNFKNYEIIIIDNYSNDETLEIAKKYTKRIYQKGPERSAQFNYGAKLARGKYLYFIGSDFILDKNHLENCLQVFKNSEIEAILTFNRSDPTLSFWAKVRNFERNMYQGDRTILASRLMTKSVFEKVGGYNENLVAFEDYELQARLEKMGIGLGEVKTAETHLGEPKSLGEIIKKSFYYGRTSGETIYGNYLKNYPGRAFGQLQPFRLAFLKNFLHLLKHPDLTLGLIIYKIAIYLGALAGFFWSKLKQIPRSEN